MAGHGKIENLRPPWKPGESRNPTGRRKRRPISDRYAYFLELDLPESEFRKHGLERGSTYADAIALG